MYLSTHDRPDCCGCGGCQQICPTHCIIMTLLDDGFFYPVVDEERCVHCDKCLNVCPIHQVKNTTQEKQEHHCYFGWHKDEGIRMKSTSGGTFSAIAELVLKNRNGAVYGALYDSDWNICHRGISTLDGLEQLRQSKYIQSDTGDCYCEIRDRLNSNEHVLFCGTPCQVDGLRRFLGKEYERLLLVDFVCHGVTSPVIFKKYIESLERKEGARVTRVRFRDKVTKRNISSIGYTTIVFESGRTKSSECNLYLRAYISGLMQRSSCERCPYASRYRRSDITVGDFWGIEEINPQLKDEFHRGISLILSNTEKGHLICEQLTDNMCMAKTDVSYAFNGRNVQLERPVEANKKKRQFYKDVKEIGVHMALAKGLGLRYLILMYCRWCINIVKAYLPKRVYGSMVFLKRSFSKFS